MTVREAGAPAVEELAAALCKIAAYAVGSDVEVG
jgi:hypothetical protein